MNRLLSLINNTIPNTTPALRGLFLLFFTVISGVAYANQTEVTLNSGILTITDINGGSSNDALTISHSGSTYTIADTSLNIITSISGATGSGSTSITVPDSGVTGINFNLLAGDDSVTVDSLQSSFSSNFTITGGTGTDSVTISNGANIVTTGTGAVNITVSESISSGNGTISTVNGGITLSANNGGATAGASGVAAQRGLDLEGTITTSGTGDIQLIGYARDDVSLTQGSQQGVQFSGTMQSTATGSNAGQIIINGYSGAGTNINYATHLQGSSISSVDGNISITGVSDSGSTGFLNHGVLVQNGSITSTGTGANAATITINGTGGGGSSNNNGVRIEGTVSSTEGAIQITGTGGSGSSNGDGIILLGGSVKSTGTGASAASITMMGTAASAGVGVRVDNATGEVTSVDGAINITGSGSGAGVRITNDGKGITSTGSASITVTGSSSSSNAIRQDAGIIGGASATGTITLIADTFNLAGGSIQSSGALTIEPETSSTSIGLGGGSGTLNLTDAEIALLADGFSSITIGNSNSGAVDIDSATFTDPATILGNPIDSDGASSGATLTDTVAPSTTSFTRQTPSGANTNADTLVFRATFSETVNSVSTNDFTVTGTSATVTSVSGSGSIYDITVSGGDLVNYNGTVGLNLVSSPTIYDTSNTLPNTEPSTDETYSLDNTAPSTTSFTRKTPTSANTNADTLVFLATFSEDVTGVNSTDFSVTGVTGGSISVTQNTASTYDVQISGGDLASANSTVGLNLNSPSITDSVGNAVPNSEPSTDQTYSLDNTAPSTTSFTRKTPAGTSTNADTLIFLATFSEDVTSVDNADFSVTGVTGGTISVTQNTASTYDVQITGGNLASLNGTVGLNLNSPSITDSVGNAVSNSEPSTDETYSLDNTSPSTTSFTRKTPAGASTNVDTLVFLATFSEAVTGVDNADFSVTGVTGGTISVTQNTTNTYDVQISGGDLANLNGTVALNLNSPSITDLTGNALPNSEPSTDQSYSVDNTAPSTTSFTRKTPTDENTNADTLTFLATFSEDVTGVDNADFSITGVTGGTISVTQNTASTYDVQISGGDLASLNGTVALNFNSPAITDLVGNALPNTEPSTDETYSLDNIAPSTTSFTRKTPSTETTDADTLTFLATFSEDVTGVDNADFAVTGSIGTSINVSQLTAQTYDVTISGGNLATFHGTVGLNLASGQNITDNVGNALPNTEPSTDETYNIDNITTEVTLVGGVLTITDTVDGNSNDTLTLSYSGGTYTLVDTGNLVIDASAVSGGISTSVSFADTGITGIHFNLLDGNDSITINSLPSLSDGLAVTDGVGTDTVNIGGAINIGSGLINITAEAINTTAAVTANGSISLTTDNLSLGANLSGSGLLTIQPQTTTTAINLGTGATDSGLQLDDTELAFLQDGFSGITIGDVASGTGAVTVNASAFLDSVSIAGGNITVSGAITNQANEGIELLSTNTVTISGSGSVATTGTGAINIEAVRNIALNSGSSLSVVNGNLTLTANNAATASGSFAGINLNNATVTTSGTGAISMTGKGGNSSGGNSGVLILNGSTVQSTAASGGSITINGTAGTGGTSNNSNHGVRVNGSGSLVSSVDGDINLTGTAAGGSSSTQNHGLYVDDGGQVIASGNANITGVGNGGTGQNNQHGVLISGSGSKIQVATGNMDITGTAGGNDGSNSKGQGVRLTGNSDGLLSTGSGNIKITGVSGTNNNDGIRLQSNNAGTIGGASATGTITLIADYIRFDTGAVIQGSGALTIQPNTAGTSIGLGGGSGTLNLDDNELGYLQDGFSSITIGDATTGAVDVNSATFNDPTTIIGSAIDVDAGTSSGLVLSVHGSPSTTSFTRQTPTAENTNADSLVFLATLSETVYGLASNDFSVTGTSASVTNITDSGNGDSYAITVSGGDLASYTGTVGLNLASGVTINDANSNALPNTEPSTDETYSLDNIVPTVTVAIVDTSLNDADNSSVVNFTFSENITGFISSDLTVAGGTISGFSFSDGTSSGSATFTANDNSTTTGSVTVDANSYTDMVGNNGVAGNDTVTVDTTNPTVTVDIVDAALSDTDNSSIVSFTFSENVTGFTSSDLTVVGGVISGFSFTDGNSAGSATFTATDGSTATGSVTVNASSYTDMASNTGAGGNDTVTIDTANPVVTDVNISISGATGTGGTFKVGDTVTVTWNNTAGGDNNTDINAVTVDFSSFGGGSAIAASNSSETWTATYTIVAGSIDTTSLNVAVTAIDNAANTTTTNDSTNATVDNQAPTVTDANISLSGGTGAGGTFIFNDTVTATWNNTADNNVDIVSVSVDFSALGGGSSVSTTESAGSWTATYTISETSISGNNLNVSVTATDDAANTTTTADTSNAIVNKASLVINELDYDQGATDNAEFIEIKNISGNPIDLGAGGYSVQLINSDGLSDYQTFGLSGTLADGDYYVLCDATTKVFNCDQAVSLGDGFINDGSPNAVAIVKSSNIVDTVSYEGITPNSFTETATAPTDDGTAFLVGLSRTTDGTDTDNNSADFGLRCVTPGGANNLTASSNCFQISIDDPTAIIEGDSGTQTINFTVSLSHAASAAVTLNYATADATATITGGDYVSNTGTVTFPANSNAAQTVSVIVNGDEIDEGTSETLNVNLSNPSVNAQLSTSSGTGTITDDDGASFSLSKTTAAVSEPATTDTFTVVLGTQPESNVVLDISSDTLSASTLSPDTLTFTSSDWNVAQTVTITAVDDVQKDGIQSSTVTVSVNAGSSNDRFDALFAQTVAVTTADDDVPGINVSSSSLSVSEPNSSASFVIRLNTQPKNGNSVDISSVTASNGECSVSPDTATISNADWNTGVSFTVTAIDDSRVEGTQSCMINIDNSSSGDTDYDNLDPIDVTVTIADDDIAGDKRFNPPLDYYLLSVAGSQAHIKSNPSSIDCEYGEGTCSVSVKRGETVKLELVNIKTADGFTQDDYTIEWYGDEDCNDQIVRVYDNVSCAVRVYGKSGIDYSAGSGSTESTTVTNQLEFLNFSGHGALRGGAEDVFLGFILEGSGTADVQLRADVLDVGVIPQLDINQLTFENNNWVGHLIQRQQQNDSFTLNQTVNAGTYTIQMSSNGTKGRGMASISLTNNQLTLTNLSVRGHLQGALIFNFIVAGEGSQQIRVNSQLLSGQVTSQLRVLDLNSQQNLPATTVGDGIIVEVTAGSYAAILDILSGEGIGMIELDLVE
ncbi:Ig-like domain-containing protein [Candidatus Albibeggiatoa sp. nov. NOAA]|uniref:Ig-like domain-containing protein n=1 Tax=Candidatus Albibeggiatoa sp. nov. NOAA TaxID=3162724 RepID=UPI0032F6C703|nr:Ig-like domain-containing protein [Thiotrichaceae bacterium]